ERCLLDGTATLATALVTPEPAVFVGGATAMAIGAGYGCFSHPTVPPPGISNDGELAPPTRFASETDYRNYILSWAIANYSHEFGQPAPTWNNYYPGWEGTATVPLMMAAGATLSAASSDFTQTNNQVHGVDEGDLVKTDGQYIYLLSGQNLVILNAVPGT